MSVYLQPSTRERELIIYYYILDLGVSNYYIIGIIKYNRDKNKFAPRVIIKLESSTIILFRMYLKDGIFICVYLDRIDKSFKCVN